MVNNKVEYAGLSDAFDCFMANGNSVDFKRLQEIIASADAEIEKRVKRVTNIVVLPDTRTQPKVRLTSMIITGGPDGQD